LSASIEERARTTGNTAAIADGLAKSASELMGGAPVYCVIHDVKQRDKAFPATLADLAFPIRTTGRRCADRARPNLSNAVKSEKHGEVAPEDLSGNLIVQLGLATEKLNGAVVSKAPPKGGISCGVVQPPLDPFFCCRPMR
jgi:hypothetical protein